MAVVICVKCDRCDRLGTNDLKWTRKLDILRGPEGEELLCVCGNKTWKFIEVDSDKVTSDLMVIKDVGIQQ